MQIRLLLAKLSYAHATLVPSCTITDRRQLQKAFMFKFTWFPVCARPSIRSFIGWECVFLFAGMAQKLTNLTEGH